jgi:hypothetical protein
LELALSRFLSKYLFTSARIIAAHFWVARHSVKTILEREFGLQKFSRRWLLHQLSEAQKESRVDSSRELFQILEDRRELQFDEIATGDESWFRYLIQSDSMFASAREAMTMRIKPDISTKNYAEGILENPQAFGVQCSTKGA